MSLNFEKIMTPEREMKETVCPKMWSSFYGDE